ncbi:LANO_0H24410g1_1 [Lachancea nothofagi CBS 11611]|uniref:Mediator of RNA polymerase II transcription subunit 17 n=1 Tax=Lachancea nothofagi CBS 11611 TaxID=1266666 RepID=A0A1G4KNX9_9SACH|nr:LANO_0H24410g1_1 [Lachancea nothofagi CBS 11611]
MTEEGANGRQTEDDGMRKIPLAIDPNLIRLIPSFVPPANDQDAEEKISEEAQKSMSSAQSLVNNPYESFGSMPLDQLIPIILQSRGIGSKFADLSEDTLMEEIAKESNTQVDTDGDVNMDNTEFASDADQQAIKPQQIEDSSPEDEESHVTQEQFQQLKLNTAQSLNLALNESSLALEFVSLLLSSVRPSAANASMSPFLKKTVPPASLNAEKIPAEKPKDTEILDRNLVTKGWKLRSLEESRILLKETHKALETSLETEHSYWSKVAHYISKKDVVFKMKDKETGEKSLGLKYGYEDSGSTYRQERGIAILRHNANKDNLEVIPSEKRQQSALGKDNSEKFMRVRIFNKIQEEDDYVLSGETSLEDLLVPNSITAGENDIRRQISKLQFIIFEKELMFHLKKESENLISYGVTIENENKVTVEFPTEKMEFEMMKLNDDLIMNHQQDAPKTNDRKASLILVMLRLLLVVMFKKQLKKKLLTGQKDFNANSKVSRFPESEALLLRPIMGKFRHGNYLNLLQKVIETYILEEVEGSTVVRVALGNFRSNEDYDEPTYDKHIVKLDREIRLFDQILQTPRTDLLVSLPASGKIEFSLQSSNYCNATTSVKYIDATDSTVFDTKFSNFKELEDFLHFIVSEYVKSNTAQV